MSVTRSVVTGVGSYLPELIVSNADLAKVVDTSDEWIQERTGIKQRHKARDDQPTSDLAVEAARGRKPTLIRDRQNMRVGIGRCHRLTQQHPRGEGGASLTARCCHPDCRRNGQVRRGDAEPWRRAACGRAGC